MENPLLTESAAPFGAPQFDKIADEHDLPAFEAGIAEAKAEIDAIIANQEEPTFENTIEAMEYAGQTRPLTAWQASSTTLWRRIQMTRCRRLQSRFLLC